MSSLFTRYKAIAVVSLLVLFFTQCYMTYHTYAWKDHDYHALIKPLLGKKFLNDLGGDIVFPGSEKILHDFTSRNQANFERLYREDTTAFKRYAQRAVDTLFQTLRAHGQMDSFMLPLFQELNLDPATVYRVAVQELALKMGDQNVILFSTHDQAYDPRASVGGSLEDCTEANRFTTIFVDSKEKCNCFIRFSLWVDSPNRTREILQSLLPILVLSLASITIMVLLFFFTFRNWARQKKLADLKQDFVNNITHELNTPLTTIIVANRNLQSDLVGGRQDQRASLNTIIERNALWLKSLFARVLQSEAISRTTLDREDVSLHVLMKELIEDYSLTLGKTTKITITLSTFGDERLVSLDKFWFTSMINNLIENGIKYNRSEQVRLHFSINYRLSGVRVTLQDNGIGMEESTQRRIFDKFYRTKEGPKDGLGLGLFYVKQCADAHGWQIAVESKPGQGSCFTIDMPAG